MRSGLLAFFLVLVAQPAVPQDAPEPVLISASMPFYPPIALSARVSGDVSAEFTLSADGTVSDVEILSGPALLRSHAKDAIQSWKFRVADKAPGDRRYKTMFMYRLSKRQVDLRRLTVSIVSFHQIEIVSDPIKATLQY